MEDLKITGEVEDIIYRNKDNGYTVFSLTTEDDEVTCVGVVPQIHSGEALEIHGSWAMHPLYGKKRGWFMYATALAIFGYWLWQFFLRYQFCL